MNRQIDRGIDRYVALELAAREAFGEALGAFLALYSFLSQVMPYPDGDLEKLYVFARFFQTKLPRDPHDYRLDRIAERSLLDVREPAPPLKGPTEVGMRRSVDEHARLSEIIDVLNERFGTEFNAADQVLFDQFVVAAKLDPEIVQQASANELDNFELAARSRVLSLMADRLEDNGQIVTRILNDEEFRRVSLELVIRRIYDELRRPSV
ncbi:MAG TPA: hypothetical protein VHB21_06285 [Minicystis sp.]|nr:hypothetical protein [Minicystis sp.]